MSITPRNRLLISQGRRRDLSASGGLDKKTIYGWILFKVHSIECQDASFYIIKIGSTSRTTLTSGRLIIDLFSSHKLLRNRWSGLTSKPFKRICHRYFLAILKSGASMGPNISRDLDSNLFFCFNVLQRSPMV